MQNYIGAKKEIAFTKETVRGTSETYGAGDWQPHLGYDFKPIAQKVKDDPAMGRIETVSDSVIVKESSGGNVPLRLTKEFVGHIFNMVMGQEPTTTGAGPYTHTWSVLNNNEHITYTVTVKDPIKGFKKYPFGMPSEVNLEFVLDGLAKATLNMLGGKEEAGVAGATSYSLTDEFFKPADITVTIADTYAGLSAGDALVIENVAVTFQKNVEPQWALGSGSPVDMVNQAMGVGINITSPYETTVLRDLALSNTKKALQIKVDNGDDCEIYIKLPRVSFEEWNPTNDNSSYLKNSVAVFAERDATNGLLVLELVNSVSSY